MSIQANRGYEVKPTERRGPVEPVLLSPEQLAVYLGCGRTYAYKLIAESLIPSVKLGRLRRVRRQDADTFIEQLAEQFHQRREVDM